MCPQKWFDKEWGGNVYETLPPPPLHLFTLPQAGRISKPILFILVWVWISILNFIDRSMNWKKMMRWQKYGKGKTSQKKISKIPVMKNIQGKASDKNDSNDSLVYWNADGFFWFLFYFIKLMTQVIKSNHSIESIQKLFEIFPSSIYMARQRIYLERDSFQKYVVCTVCHSSTTYEDSWTKSLTGKKKRSIVNW